MVTGNTINSFGDGVFASSIGGTGGSGKDVTVILNNGAAISSTGQSSNGVLAQSLGDVAGSGNLTDQNTPSMKDPYPNGSVGAINRGSAGGKGHQ